MTLKGISIFELIYSDEIYISSNKNHYYFLQFNEVMNRKFNMFLVFGAYQIMWEVFFVA